MMVDHAQQIWTEKYRPTQFADVLGQEHVVDKIKAFVKQGNMPHLLFSGPAGVGKTTLSLALAKELFGEHWQSNFLETNASDERGIDVIRNKVKDFARTKAINTTLPKIVYLDECDSLTKEAQQALRRTMETYSGTARFILSCNFSSKIIDPIQSRCAVFRFKHLTQEAIIKLVDRIATKESMTIDAAAKEAIFTVSGGDVRRVVNILQSCAVMETPVTEQMVFDIANYARPKDVDTVIKMALDGAFKKSRDKLLDVIHTNGLSGLDIIKQIQAEIMNMDIDQHVKLRMIERCGEVEFRLVEGSDPFIQLEALLASFGMYKA